jgi:hypothetical protein
MQESATNKSKPNTNKTKLKKRKTDNTLYQNRNDQKDTETKCNPLMQS